MSNLIRSNKKLFVNSGGVLDPSIKPRIENLENNEYKILYFETISSTTGTITKPTNSTILLDQFYSGGDAIVETLVNGQPSGQSPLTAGGSVVSVSSFDTSGNFTLSGTPSSYPVALIYIFTIKAVDYSNVVKANEMNMENNGLAPLASPTFTGVTTFQNIIRLTSASLGTAVAGNIEFLTDKFYGVITTGTSRKEFVLADTALTSGRLIFTTTNGRAVDSSLITYNGATVTIDSNSTSSALYVVGANSGTNLTNGVGMTITNSNNTTGNVASMAFTSAVGAAYASYFGAKFVDRTNNYADFFIATRSASTALTSKLYIKSTGEIGLGSNFTTPTARLHIAAGTATAGTAPLKLTSGINLTTPENGAFEYDGTNLYFTTGGVRKTVTLV